MIDIVLQKRVRQLTQRITQLITQSLQESPHDKTLRKLEKNWSTLKRYLP